MGAIVFAKRTRAWKQPTTNEGSSVARSQPAQPLLLRRCATCWISSPEMADRPSASHAFIASAIPHPTITNTGQNNLWPQPNSMIQISRWIADMAG